MKKIISSFVLLILIYIFSGPFFTVAALNNGIQEGDTDAIDENVDFPILRENIKGQLKAWLTKESSLTEPDMGELLTTGVLLMIMEGGIDNIITPHGVVEFLSDGSNNNETQPTPSNESVFKLFENSSFKYNTLNRFTISVVTATNHKIPFTLKRYGLSWKLTNVKLPASIMSEVINTYEENNPFGS